MNILFVDAHNPFEPQKNGASQRSHLLVEALAQFAHVDVVVLRPGAVSDVNNADVIFSDFGNTCYDVTRSWKLKRLLRPWCIESFFPAMEINQQILYPIVDNGKYDYIVVRYLDVALQCGLQKYNDRLIVDVDDRLDDVEWMLAKQAKTLRSKFYHGYASLSMKYSLDRAIRSSVITFFPNKSQARYINSVYLPNIPYYEVDALPLPEANNHRLIFVGDLRYEPNYLGVGHFIENILPQVQKQIPDVQLILVGKYNDAWKNHYNHVKGVVFRGFVDNLREEYQAAAVCVVPVYSGAGTNIKVLESMQMGRACVTTPSASKGFHDMLQSDQDYIIAPNDKTFANKVVALLQDEVKRNQLANNGRMAVEKVASRKSFYQIVKKSFGQML